MKMKMKLMPSLKTKSNIARVLQIIIFGTFSYWFTHRYGVDFISIEYGLFFFGTMLTAFVYGWEEVLKTKIKNENQKILDIFENAKKIHNKKKESN